MTDERISRAKKHLEKRWDSQGECRSCGWHAGLHEYFVEDSDLADALDNNDGILELPCLSDDDDTDRHRGVRVNLNESTGEDSNGHSSPTRSGRTVTLAETIKAAQKRVADWPEWMRRVAYFEGGDKRGLNIPPFDKPPQYSGKKAAMDDEPSVIGATPEPAPQPIDYLLAAARSVLEAVDDRVDNATQPLKYTVPWARLTALRTAVLRYTEGEGAIIKDLQSKLDRLRPFVEEIRQAHRDKSSADYNQCEEAECAWCQGTREALSDE